MQIKIVELYDTMSEVLEYQERAKKVYKILKRKHKFDYCFVLDDGVLMYKVTVTTEEDESKISGRY